MRRNADSVPHVGKPLLSPEYSREEILTLIENISPWDRGIPASRKVPRLPPCPRPCRRVEREDTGEGWGRGEHENDAR